jgi:hypothetical protein
MQQATAQNPSASAPSGPAGPAATARNLFVINLCASTTPVALTPPDHAGLKRFTFFVSRRREEGRERFRLHMGYFDSQEEAEKLLDIVREIYPGAWAGLSPGQRLRARAQAQAEAAAADATAAAETENINPALSKRLDAVAAKAAPSQPVVQPEPIAQPTAVAASAPEAPLSLLPDEGRRVSAVHATGREHEAARHALSNVRAAIASLDDSGSAPTLAPLPELKPAIRNPSGTQEAPRDLSESAALSVLENKSDTGGATTVNQPRLPVIDNNSTPATAAAARPRDEKTAYAVQLLWSVQPIDMDQIPQLAIFSAYTLYGAEGNRDGRRWYGVRLGFFTDAVSAKQVAHYVRSDFSTVSVVPVTVRERERAKIASTRPDATPVGAAPAAATPPAAVAEPKAAAKPGFEFIEDTKPAPAARAAVAGDAARGARGAPGKRAKLRTGRQVSGRAKSKPMTLEETLEILGAGQLQMDDGRRPLINETAPRAPSREPAKGKPSRFGRLLERLSERLGS